MGRLKRTLADWMMLREENRMMRERMVVAGEIESLVLRTRAHQVDAKIADLDGGILPSPIQTTQPAPDPAPDGPPDIIIEIPDTGVKYAAHRTLKAEIDSRQRDPAARKRRDNIRRMWKKCSRKRRNDQ